MIEQCSALAWSSARLLAGQAKQGKQAILCMYKVMSPRLSSKVQHGVIGWWVSATAQRAINGDAGLTNTGVSEPRSGGQQIRSLITRLHKVTCGFLRSFLALEYVAHGLELKAAPGLNTPRANELAAPCEPQCSVPLFSRRGEYPAEPHCSFLEEQVTHFLWSNLLPAPSALVWGKEGYRPTTIEWRRRRTTW